MSESDIDAINESLNNSDVLTELINQIALSSSGSNSVESSPVCELDSDLDASVSSPTTNSEESLLTGVTCRTSLRSRRLNSNSNNDDNLHKTKRRTISKPRKLNPATLSSDASEKLIEKLYTNKKLTKLKPTNLETIFEEPKEKNETVTYFSVTRFKRSITFADCYNVPKKTVLNRRKRIKRLFGGKKLKKMSMDAFKNHFDVLRGSSDFE